MNQWIKILTTWSKVTLWHSRICGNYYRSNTFMSHNNHVSWKIIRWYAQRTIFPYEACRMNDNRLSEYVNDNMLYAVKAKYVRMITNFVVVLKCLTFFINWLNISLFVFQIKFDRWDIDHVAYFHIVSCMLKNKLKPL